MVLAGTFSDTLIQVTATVSAGVLIACLIAAVRFTMHVRDSINKQDAQLRDIGKAVNHVPPGEPRLYDLVVEGVERGVETANQSHELASTMHRMRGTVEEHLDDDRRRFAKQDQVLDEVRGVVIDLRDKVEDQSTALERLETQVDGLTTTVDGLISE
jgi:uncharacterized coiled-coil protein SlyX